MPLTILWADPHDKIGPGLPIRAAWSGGAAPIGNRFVVEAYNPSLTSTFTWQETFPLTTSSVQIFYPWSGQGTANIHNTGQVQMTDDNVTVVTYTLDTSSTVHDFQTTTKVWEGREGVPAQILMKQSGGGLTTGQAAQLTTVEANTNAQQTQWTDYTTVTLPSLQDVLNGITTGITTTITGAGGAIGQTLGQLFSGKTFDLITTFDLGSVCWPDQFDQNIGGGTFFGVQMQATEIPDYYAFTGSADDYCVESLATVEIVRGGNTILWHGMHTRNYMVYPLPGVPFFELELSMPSAPGDYHIKVSPNVGVCVAVQLLQFP